jgi:hypothetical protein
VDGVVNEKGEKKVSVPQNLTDYGKVIAARIEPRLYAAAEGNMEWFNTIDCTFGYWAPSKKGHALTRMVRDCLEMEFKDYRLVCETGDDCKERLVLRKEGAVPATTKRPELYNKVAADVFLSLMRMPSRSRDGEHTRGLLMDRNGLVYDYARGTFYPNSPGLRMGFRCPWSFNEVWKVSDDVRVELDTVIGLIVKYWGDGKQAAGKSLEQDPVFGKPLADRYRALVKNSPGLWLQRAILEIYCDDVDEMLYKLLL